MGALIADVLDALVASPDDNGAAEAAARDAVLELTGRFPVYQDLD